VIKHVIANIERGSRKKKVNDEDTQSTKLAKTKTQGNISTQFRGMNITIMKKTVLLNPIETNVQQQELT
jgi:hypothetical protein